MRLLCASEGLALGFGVMLLREDGPRRPAPETASVPRWSPGGVSRVQSPSARICACICGSPPAADLDVSPEGSLEVTGSDWHQLRPLGASELGVWGILGRGGCGQAGKAELWLTSRVGGFSGSAAGPGGCAVTPSAVTRQHGPHGCCPWGGSPSAPQSQATGPATASTCSGRHP